MFGSGNGVFRAVGKKMKLVKKKKKQLKYLWRSVKLRPTNQ